VLTPLADSREVRLFALHQAEVGQERKIAPFHRDAFLWIEGMDRTTYVSGSVKELMEVHRNDQSVLFNSQ